MGQPTRRKLAIGGLISTFVGIAISWGIWSLDSRVDSRASSLDAKVIETRIVPLERAYERLIPGDEIRHWQQEHKAQDEKSEKRLDSTLDKLDSSISRLTDEVNKLNRAVDVINARIPR